MARRDSDSLEDLLDALSEAPWWVSLLVGLIVYFVLKFVLPLVFTGNDLGAALARALSQLAWMSVIFIVPAIISAGSSIRRRWTLDHQRDLESIRALSWTQFEEVVGEAYRRQGFAVTQTPAGADGGIDLVIRRATDTYLVQCKQWRTHRVGVKVVREMLGLVTARRATGAIVVTAGEFTNEAKDFAARQPVELIDGPRLAQLIRVVQKRPATSLPSVDTPAHACPRCGRELVLRTARRGAHAGGQFWGCSGYPSCRHMEPFTG